MKNSFGNTLIVTLFGESHGSAIGAVLDGMTPGIEIDEAFIARQLCKRRGQSNISTSRRESDEFRILSGVFNGRTTGTPITFLIENIDKKSGDYADLKCVPRPSHADYTAQCKYHGFQDYRGGGHFSGRITAGIVAAGSVCLSALRKKGILIGSHILSCGTIRDRGFEDFIQDISILDDLSLPVLSDERRREIEANIEKLRSEGNSIGGTIQTVITGLPAGVGEPWFDTLEGMIAKAVFSIPAVKGIEFGAGFSFSGMSGTEANDPFVFKDGSVITKTNNNGGINGGITNGMPVLFNTAVKPTPSIYKEQRTVDLSSGRNTSLIIEGRHDPAIVHRAAVVVDSITAIVVCDLLLGRYGTDYLRSDI